MLRKIHHFIVAATFVGTAGLSAPAFAQLSYGPTFGGSGGGAYDLQCPGSSPWMTGVTSRWGSYVDSIKGQCGSQSTGWAGGAGGTEGSVACGAGRVVVGLIPNSGSFLDGAWILCADFTAVANGSTGSQGQGFIGGTGGTWSSPWQCPQQHAAVGIHGGAGQFVDRLGLVCKRVN